MAMMPPFRSCLWLLVSATVLLSCRHVQAITTTLPDVNEESMTCSSELGVGVCFDDDDDDDIQQHPHCVDRDERCGSMAYAGKCDSHPSVMFELCPRSCDVCL